MTPAAAGTATAAEIAAAVRRGAITAVAVLDAHLARIDALNPSLNAFTTVTRARARGEAAPELHRRRVSSPRHPVTAA